MRRILFGHPAERVDRDWISCGAGFAESFKSGAGGDQPVCDRFAEDRSEQDGVGAIAAGDLNLGEGVAGDRDDRCRKVKGCVTASNVIRQ